MENKTDAETIAAELLAVLKLAIDATPRRYTDKRDARGDRVAEYPAWVAIARAAVDKAENRPC